MSATTPPFEGDPLEGLPDDLARLLRDPSIIVPQDAAVFEMVAKWADVPSDTASAMSVDEWRQAWIVACRRMLDAQALFESLRVWTLEHLDALDDDVLDADGEGVLNSLRMIVSGEMGCTEREDYTDARWAVLQASRKAVAP